MCIRMLSLAAFTAQIALGNACMMPVAMAQDDMLGMHHDMSTMDDANNDGVQESHGRSCDSGHCFVHAMPAAEQTMTSPDVQVCPSMPIAVEVPVLRGSIAYASPGPPVAGAHMRSVVMRM